MTPEYAYVARRDKSGTRVLCGGANRTCRGQFGEILIGKLLYLDFGWQRRPDGVLALTTHALKRYQRGLNTKDRRGYRRPMTMEDRRRSFSDRRRPLTVHSPELPAVAICPRCGARNLLDMNALGISLNGGA